MFSPKEMPSPQSLFSAYASMAGSLMLFRSMANDLIPAPVRSYIGAGIRRFFNSHSTSLFTLIIEDTNGMSPNQIFDAAETYLSTKITSDTARLRITKTPRDKHPTLRLEAGEKLTDSFEGISLLWTFNSHGQDKNLQAPNDITTLSPLKTERHYFELKFDKTHRRKIINSYIPFMLERALALKNEERALKMYTINSSGCFSGKWESVNLEHPATFETVAMEAEAKRKVIEDLERFLKRKEFYKRVGRAWKRGYLLHGPPGTGKSSLVAAMANYLKFDIYDLQLANVHQDSDLRKLLLTTGNRSILVIEDIDCTVELPDRRPGDWSRNPSEIQLTLSGLLNFIDGLWSSCGDERIIIFTTNHKDRLDSALLRPGRMDMHIHMSYCTFHGFKLLATNYLQIHTTHRLFPEIETLLDAAEVTPAEIAEELMKSEDAEVSLQCVVKLLKRKKLEEEENGNGEEEEEEGEEDKVRAAKRLKVLAKKKVAGMVTRRKFVRR
ncbi:AAA-ATPase At5g17760-like isoform X1 [Cucurbita moschata]|uniref:AAA-ATPase At5g17760-like isoform X1 n=1 Tax=Cucurbita moschata TaxID=3662 RepID=A0A6J1FWA7_CUCMO|nr:AAA-ATPase At5g17760-like isoform X1 [Cucurbita moschata]